MAYMPQEKKKKIALALKAAKLPKTLKWSLSVDNRSTLVITITQAPATALDDYISGSGGHDTFETEGYMQANTYHPGHAFGGDTLRWIETLIRTVKEAGEWYDKSDSQTDYFNIAFYIDLNFGRYNKPCVFVGKRRRAKAEPAADSVLARSLDILINHRSTNVTEKPIPGGYTEDVAATVAVKRRLVADAEQRRLDHAIAAMKATAVGSMLSDDAITVLARAVVQGSAD